VGQRLLLSLPAVAAAIVAWAVLGGRGGHVRYAQVLGGPTGAVSSVLVRSLELERDGRVIPSPGLALRLIVESGGARTTLAGTTDATGHLELRLDAERPPAEPWLRVESGEPPRVLVEGRPSLPAERWGEAAHRSGGWLGGQTRGPLLVRVAAESGTFAVPFAGVLLVQVQGPPAGDDPRASVAGEASSASDRPISGARIEVELTGAALVEPPPPTTESGLSRVELHPDEHAVSARIVALAGGYRGEWFGALPVTPGALVATRSGDALVVRSPIVRERAFASIVSAEERIAGAIVPLEAQADGSASGSLPLDTAVLRRIEREPTWVVVSSEYDKRSAGVVGWPLKLSGFGLAAPPHTFDVADAVLLDGRAGAIHAAERERAGRRRLAAGALLAVGSLMTASFWRAVRRGKGGVATRARAIESADDDTGHHEAAARQVVAEGMPLAPGGWVLVVALGCIVLGLGGLAYFGLTH